MYHVQQRGSMKELTYLVKALAHWELPVKRQCGTEEQKKALLRHLTAVTVRVAARDGSLGNCLWVGQPGWREGSRCGRVSGSCCATPCKNAVQAPRQSNQTPSDQAERVFVVGWLACMRHQNCSPPFRRPPMQTFRAMGIMLVGVAAKCSDRAASGGTSDDSLRVDECQAPSPMPGGLAGGQPLQMLGRYLRGNWSVLLDNNGAWVWARVRWR